MDTTRLDIAIEALKRLVVGTVDDIYTEVRDEWPVATSVSKVGNKKEITTQKDAGRVYNDVPHSKFVDNIDGTVEYVRRPNSKYPPSSAIEEWVRIKGIAGGVENARQIAFLIARSIAKKGIKNKKIYYRAEIRNAKKIEAQSAKIINTIRL